MFVLKNFIEDGVMLRDIVVQDRKNLESSWNLLIIYENTICK